MHLPRPPWRRSAVWASAALTSATLLTGLPAAAADTGPVPSASASAKIDSALRGAVDHGREVSFFVVMKNQADLAPARRERTHAAKAGSAFDALRTEARSSQKSLTAFLDKERVGHQNYWIANAVQVTGGQALVDQLAKRSDVARIVKEQSYELDETESKVSPAPSVSGASVAGDDTPEWGVKDIEADQVWSQYESRGEGIVIASVDSGVQYNHPDLVANYRGNNGNGAFSHDYNFYDPTGNCPSDGTPCDNNGHGTHTMGTMVGKGGIGVAPNAKWIAAKGCESSKCSDEYLLKAGQWILAPTDHTGQNPRPELAPNIVNNSWGGGDTTFYQDIVEAWNSAGIFEAFAAGNDGDGATCSTAHAPGSQAPAYGVGAYDVNGKIAKFSGFGPSLVDNSMKPNISAPGVDVRSTWPGSSYSVLSGTSMATPHVAGAVALLWSAAPSLIGKIDETRALLDGGASDVDDTHCGGTAAMNNVWGEGKLDILSSIDKAPHIAATVTGTATDKATGAALSGVTVDATTDGTTRTVTTADDGTYRLTLAAGTYDFSYSGYGYSTDTVTGVAVAQGQALTQNITLDAVPLHAVSGTVVDVTGKPLAKATVAVAGTPVPAVVTDTAGHFTLPKVSEGTFTLTATPAAPVLCNGVSDTELTIDADKTMAVRLPARSDASGNSCTPATYSWIKGSTKVALSSDEDAKNVALPFPVKFYGTSYNSAAVTTNGLINFLGPRVGDYTNTALPTAAKPDGIVAPLWDDLMLDKTSSVQTATTGRTGARTFAVVWNNVLFADGGTDRATFEAVFDEATGAITFQYKTVPGNGGRATVGIENQTGTDALQYSFNQTVLTNGSAIRIAQEVK
ncbi:S8 family serine peptidase [Streptomyces sp. NPDC005786]|uniref:S8 family serine peptidase n=1 Tax=Streptomyces sp. NPDC005786 TaxID=3154891 RepID=UPI0033F282E2